MRHLIFLLLLLLLIARAQAQPELQARPDSDTPDTLRHAGSSWLNAGNKKGASLVRILSAAGDYGLHPEAYPVDQLRHLLAQQDQPAPGPAEAEQIFQRAAFRFCSDLYCGSRIHRVLRYDGISKKYGQKDSLQISGGLESALTGLQLDSFIRSLEPNDERYLALKDAFLTAADSPKAKRMQLEAALDTYRWIRHFRFDSFIVVNIPAATLSYFRFDSLRIIMKTVVGKPETETPQFAAWCTAVTLYPYWNMPRSILINEWFDAFRRSPDLISYLNMELIDGPGHVVNPHKLNWKRLSKRHFPYRIREKSGCTNPLGVIRFTLNSPFDVYLHDTNFKGAFLAANRFYSHGCIRVEQPVALADALLADKVDQDFLNACFKDQPSQLKLLSAPVPVFVVYLCADTDEQGRVCFYKDIYRQY